MVPTYCTKVKLWPLIKQTQINIHLQSAPWCFNSLPFSLWSHPTISPTLKMCMKALYVFLNKCVLKNWIKTYRAPLYLSHPQTLPNIPHFGLSAPPSGFNTNYHPNTRFWSLKLDFWRVLQIIHFLRSVPHAYEFALYILEKLCSNASMIQHFLSLSNVLLINLSNWRLQLHYIQK